MDPFYFSQEMIKSVLQQPWCFDTSLITLMLVDAAKDPMAKGHIVNSHHELPDPHERSWETDSLMNVMSEEKVSGMCVYLFVRRAWQPTPGFLPGESPWTEEPGGLQSMESQRVGHDWAQHSTFYTLIHTHIPMPKLNGSISELSLCP